jgi:hypothetical protein
MARPAAASLEALDATMDAPVSPRFASSALKSALRALSSTFAADLAACSRATVRGVGGRT